MSDEAEASTAGEQTAEEYIGAAHRDNEPGSEKVTIHSSFYDSGLIYCPCPENATLSGYFQSRYKIENVYPIGNRLFKVFLESWSNYKPGDEYDLVDTDTEG